MSIKTIQVQDYLWQVIVNPNACNQRCFESWEVLSTKLDKKGIRHRMHKSEECGKGSELACRLCQAGERHLIVVGGDGTINEVVNGIFASGVNTQEVFLAVLPLGRGNDWARAHHFPNNPLDSIDVLLEGTFMNHDIGMVETLREDQVVATRHYINIAGFCFDADVIYDTTYNKPHFLGVSVYVLSLIRTLFRFKSPTVTVEMDNETYQGTALLLVSAICQYNGGGMRQAPMAQPDDGIMDVVIVPDVSRLRVIANIGNIFSGAHVRKIKEVQTFKTRSLLIRSKELVRGEVEGELIETGTYRISLKQKSLHTLTHLQ